MAGGDFITQVPNRLWGRTDPDQAGINDGLGKVAIFGQETISGVNSVRPRFLSSIEDLIKDQVRLCGVLAA